MGENRANPLRRFELIAKRAGIPKRDELSRSVCLPSIRRTAATLLSHARVPPVQPQHLLGHSDPKLTAALYVHLRRTDFGAQTQASRPSTEWKREAKAYPGRGPTSVLFMGAIWQC